MFDRFTIHSIMVYLISILLIISIAMPEIFAYGRYDQMQLNTTIEALVLSNGPVVKLDETSDHSSFLIEFINGMSIKVPCDFGRHYYKKVNTCVSTSKMVIIYDHCQFSKQPNCWNYMPFCFLDSENDIYAKDNCLPYFKRNDELCKCELKAIN
ncbi:hypothetical protein QLX08_009761 [Tetragonisca angustula]|uniref:Uncharacterized protein n=1 Tax=Tetragonisca angustula TaxID=166442 RepID=A0AAW0ZF31_9HYME